VTGRGIRCVHTCRRPAPRALRTRRAGGTALGEVMVEVLVVAAVVAVVLGPVVLGALGGLTGYWIGRKYVHPHHSQIHDHEVND
jgi:hypothetical protein